MLKTISNILFSTRLTAILFLLFAAAMATGTFLDAGQDTSPTPYTRTLIYNAWWFETIMVFFVINFTGNIFRFKLYRKEKWAVLLLHLSFILILLGAFITRYISFEGMMSIREGATENTFLSQKTYVSTLIKGDYFINGQQQQFFRNDVVDFSPRLNNDYKIDVAYNQQPVTIELIDFIAGAEEDIILDDNGEEYLKIVEAVGGQPHNHFLKVGEVQLIHNMLYTLNNPTEGAVNMSYKNDSLFIQSPFKGDYMVMATQEKGQLYKDSLQPLQLRSRYRIGNQTLVFPKPVIKGVFDLVKKSELLKNDKDGLVLKVTSNNESKHVRLLGGQGFQSPFKKVNVGGLDIAFAYGSKLLELPFKIKLNDFMAERHPGTANVYSAFASEVTVIDEEKDSFDYRIYMNHVLDHHGYRFFQASFNSDEKGTILSVSYDALGTWITYIGYILLFFGLLSILFARDTRFNDLRKQLVKIKNKKATLSILCLVSTLSFGQIRDKQNANHIHVNKPPKVYVDSVLKQNITPKAEADKFGHLVIQDLNGRMKPVNTYASEVLRKLSKYDYYEDFDANQVLLSIQEYPRLWYNVPIIYLRARKADSIRELIGLEPTEKYAALIDFYDKDLNYKLAPYLDDAFNAQIPNAFQKEFKETHQRVYLLADVIDGQTLKIFPLPNDANNTWTSPNTYKKEHYKLEDTLYGNFINAGFKAYLHTLNQAKKTEDFTQSDKLLDAIKQTQQKYGKAVMLSDKKIRTEVLYNKYDIFKKLFSWFMYASTLMILFLILQIFYFKNKFIDYCIQFFKLVIIGLFLLHTAGLIVRWYVSGHAPWSDAYESIIYVAWATMLFGLLLGFSKIKLKHPVYTVFGIIQYFNNRSTSNFTIAAAGFVSSMLLMIAHWNWMDPAITNLQPVLDSYWLMIHVAVIVASYGPFTLGMILGLVSLLLMILTNSKNKTRIALTIKELTIITEMALTVGLVMLAIGNFLGGMWANESWGRYWGWDPKETWALISIMIYAFVLHMRLVPGLRGRWFFNLMAILAFASIMMTYFGVNFYLSGLHSYASGDQIISLWFILTALSIIAVVALFSYRSYHKFFRK